MHCTDRQFTDGAEGEGNLPFLRVARRLFVTLFFTALVACTPARGPQESTGEISGESQRTPNPYLAQTDRAPQAARDGMEIARQAFERGDLAAAEAELTKLTESWPKLSGPWLNLGIVQRKLDKPEAAEQSLRQAVAANGDNVFAWNELAALLRDAGRFEEAEQNYREALKRWPDYADAHINLGILFDLYLHKPEEALQHYRAAQALQEEEDRRLAGWIVDLERRL
ncbi:tetratricopeptide repeat protein [Microbulbifer sp.]|uniref:tetratricopeptide repeat protein n=1 Tax=Microbulbifer sp. TaxID=1908541 RepID=UPI003F340F90